MNYDSDLIPMDNRIVCLEICYFGDVMKNAHYGFKESCLHLLHEFLFKI